MIKVFSILLVQSACVGAMSPIIQKEYGYTPLFVLAIFILCQWALVILNHKYQETVYSYLKTNNKFIEDLSSRVRVLEFSVVGIFEKIKEIELKTGMEAPEGVIRAVWPNDESKG